LKAKEGEKGIAGRNRQQGENLHVADHRKKFATLRRLSAEEKFKNRGIEKYSKRFVGNRPQAKEKGFSLIHRF